MWNLNRFLFSVIVLVTCMSITHAKEARDDSTTDGLHRERSDEPGFVQLFNGKDLSGWDGRPDCWKVRENAIWSTGKGTQRNWLIRRDVEASDFELRLQFRFDDGNSGVQVRSEDIGDWQVRGYQVEVAEHEVMGLWHHSLMSPADEIENARKHLATAGQRVSIDIAGKKQVTQFADPDELTKLCKDGQWNDLTIIADGPRLIQKINGRVFSDLTDDQKGFASTTGLVALQDHGKGTIAGFRNIRIRLLKPEKVSNDDTPADSTTVLQQAEMNGEASQHPNVLFVVVDDLNWRLGCYGDEVAHTPNMDRLAQKSVRFDRAYSNYPVCSASRTLFLSGRYPSSTGILGNGPDPREVLGSDYRFLPEYFHDHGYVTAGIGKIPHTPEHIGSIDWDFHRDTQWEPKPVFDAVVAKETLGWPESRHPDGITARLAAEFMSKKRDRPFFLAVGFHRPHAPRAAPQRYWDMFEKESLPLPEMGEGTSKGVPPIAFPPKYEPDATADTIQADLLSYHATAAFVDAQTGLLLDALDRNDLWKDNVVVFFSDHGVHLGDHGGFWGKQSLMEDSLKVPLLIHSPGAAEHASTTEVAELVDLFPTLTELCGLPSQKGVEGESLAPLLHDPAKARPKAAAFGMVRRDGKCKMIGYTVRSREWAYTEWPDGSRQLYHHAEDPEELNNVANGQEHEQVQKRLAGYLDIHRTRHPLQTAAQPLSPKSDTSQSLNSARSHSSATNPAAPTNANLVPPIYRKGGGFKPDQVIPYKKVQTRELSLDLFYPQGWEANDSRPCAVFFFGGGWNIGDTRQFYPQAEYLASRGMVAICVEYRTGSDGNAQPFECVEDAKSAMRFVRSHASQLGVDPDRIAAGGGSAGGHLAAATATIDAFDCEEDDLDISAVPNALLLFNPACDNSADGYGFDRVAEYWPADPHEVLDWRFGTQWAIRSGKWKLLQAREGKGGTIQIAKEGPVRLYNLAEDIAEEDDLALKLPDKVAQLRRQWNAWNAELPQPAWKHLPIE